MPGVLKKTRKARFNSPNSAQEFSAALAEWSLNGKTTMGVTPEEKINGRSRINTKK